MVQQPEELVELLPEADRFLSREAAVGTPAERSGLVLVHDLAGDFDAAHAGSLAGAHLLAGLPHEVIARFDTERQSLALMLHPNIANVFDAVATESGRPLSCDLRDACRLAMRTAAMNRPSNCSSSCMGSAEGSQSRVI